MGLEELGGIPDDLLVERFQAARDHTLFAELFRRYRRPVFGACWSVLHDVSAAEDMTQEAFMAALAKIDTYSSGSFSAWIRTIARNLCLNYLKARGREILDGLDMSTLESGRDAAVSELVGDIRVVLGALSPPQRRCLKLFCIEGYRHKEIVRLTGFSEKQVKSYLQNGMRRFRIEWARIAGLNDG